ncbi:unnamed protein product [Bursaphelenchus xylophilus]|uniref:(pine wood nematode) hypothetical protein n=1 Tax=Bursaphelenchus xylophilus TaxID=6326 RepID=A0A1I7RLH3_BURXY|nr:unnamed protein product [Bursaphelenchus xylophilus]CAG9082986.1 unnamed protein product [Bursaphelenchus xylophilus]
MDVDHNLRRANSLHGLNKDFKSKSSSDLFGTPRRALGDVKNNLGTPKFGGKAGFGQRLNFDEDNKGSDRCSKQTEFGDANANIFHEGTGQSLKPIKKQQQLRYGKPRDTVDEMTEQINKNIMTLQLPEIDWNDPNLKADYCSCTHDHDNDLDMYSDVEYLKTLPIPSKDEFEDDDPLMSLDDIRKLFGSSKFNWKDLLDDEVEFHFDADHGLYIGELEDTLNCDTLSEDELTL